MAFTATFGGYDLAGDWVIEAAHRPRPDFRVSKAEADGMEGFFFRGLALKPVPVSVTLAPKALDGLQGRVDRLMAALAVDGPARLEFSDEGGRYRMCVPSGAPDTEELSNFARITVEFEQPHPALYGEQKTATVGTSATSLQVGGTYPALPKVTSSNATRSSSGLWGVRIDNKGYMRVPLSTESAVAVSIDCEARAVRANGSASMLTLDSDWAELSPGSHSARIDQGGGSATVTWVERWL